MKKILLFVILSIILIFIIINIKDYYDLKQTIKLNKSFSEISLEPSSGNKSEINTSIKELYNYSYWYQIDSENMRYSIIFTDSEYCSYPLDIDYIKNHPDLIDSIVIGKYYIINDKIYLEGEKEPYFLNKNSKQDIYDASGKYKNTIQGMILVSGSGSLSKYTNGKQSNLIENRKLLEEFKEILK